MLNQLSTRQWPLPGYPGDFPFFGPMVVNPVILKTSNAALNVPGVALTYQSGSTTNAVAGGTGVFAGILSNKNTQPYDGNLPTGPVLNIPNDTPTFATSLSTGVYATLSTTARVGDGVAFNTSTGVLAAAPGGVVPNGHTLIAGAVIFRQNVDAAGTVGIVQMLNYVTPVVSNTLRTVETFDVNGNNTNTFNRVVISELARSILIIRSPAVNTAQIALGYRDADNLNNPNPDYTSPILLNPGEELFSDNDQFQYFARQNAATAVGGQYVEVERVITL